MLIMKDIRVESMKEPMGLDEATPRFSYLLEASEADSNVYQTRRRMLVSDPVLTT